MKMHRNNGINNSNNILYFLKKFPTETQSTAISSDSSFSSSGFSDLKNFLTLLKSN